MKTKSKKMDLYMINEQYMLALSSRILAKPFPCPRLGGICLNDNDNNETYHFIIMSGNLLYITEDFIRRWWFYYRKFYGLSPEPIDKLKLIAQNIPIEYKNRKTLHAENGRSVLVI